MDNIGTLARLIEKEYQKKLNLEKIRRRMEKEKNREADKENKP